MYKLVSRMSPSEPKQLTEEQDFLHKVKILRQQPLSKWEGVTWNGLDEVLRVLKDPGPVDFRRIYSDVEQKLNVGQYSSPSGIPVVKIIRNDILPYVTRSMCFETKYNAMNALVDMGMLLMKRTVSYEDRKMTFDTLFGGLFSIGQMFNEEEVFKILKEMKSEESMSDSGFLNQFLSIMDCDLRRSSRTHPYDYDNGSYMSFATQYSQRRILDNAVDRKKAQTSSRYGQKGFLVKVLYLRYSEISGLGDAKDSLDEIVSLFPDRSTPLEPKYVLCRLDEVLSQYLRYAAYTDGTRAPIGAVKEIQTCIDRSISRVSKHATRGTSLEVKLGALKILTEIGLRIVEWCHTSRPPLHRKIFQDHLSEDSLTDTMILVCDSLSKSDWVQVMEEQELLKDMVELDTRRSQIPESMEGLDSVLRVVRDPEHEISKSSRRTKAAIPVLKVDIIDLTDD